MIVAIVCIYLNGHFLLLECVLFLCSSGRQTEGCHSGIQLCAFELTHVIELKVLPGLSH